MFGCFRGEAFDGLMGGFGSAPAIQTETLSDAFLYADSKVMLLHRSGCAT